MSQVSSYLKVPLCVGIMETGREARSARVTPVPVRGLCCVHPHPFPPSPQASLRLMLSSTAFHSVSYKTLFENIKREMWWCNAQVNVIYLFLIRKSYFGLLVNLKQLFFPIMPLVISHKIKKKSAFFLECKSG